MENQRVGEALARVLEVIKGRQNIHVVHTDELKRSDRELLVKTGWLQEIIRGWYLVVRPDMRPSDSSGWYAAFWDFLSLYLRCFYGEDYTLSAENSLELLTGATVIPKQVIVMAPKGRGVPLQLPYDTSVLIYTSKELPDEREVVNGLQVMTLPFALCKVSATYFQKNSQEAETALRAIQSVDDLLRILITHNFVRAAGRLVGAYRFLGEADRAEKLAKGLSRAAMKFSESNPFLVDPE